MGLCEQVGVPYTLHTPRPPLEQAGVYYHCDQIIKGMYSEYMPEWQAYIRPQRLLVLRTEDYFARPLRGVRQVWRLRTPTLTRTLPTDH